MTAKQLKALLTGEVQQWGTGADRERVALWTAEKLVPTVLKIIQQEAGKARRES